MVPSITMVHPFILVLSRILVHPFLLVLSKVLVHPSLLVLSACVVHPIILVLSMNLVHTASMAPSKDMVVGVAAPVWARAHPLSVFLTLSEDTIDSKRGRTLGLQHAMHARDTLTCPRQFAHAQRAALPTPSQPPLRGGMS